MKLDNRYHILLLAVIILAVYYPALFAPFNSLDDKLLVQSLINSDTFSWSQHFFPGGRGDYYRPFITLSYEFDKLAWGLEESFMHLESILVHAFNAILLFLVANRLVQYFNLAARWLPFVVATMFALHPVNTEAVNWITARADLVAASGVYLSLFGLVHYLGTGRVVGGVLAAVAMGLAALAKEPALFLLPGALLIIWWCRNDDIKQIPQLTVAGKLVVSLAYLITVLGYFALRWAAFHSDRGIENTVKIASAIKPSMATTAQGVVPTSVALLEASFKATGFYFKKIFWPFPLNFAITNVSDGYVYVGWLVLLLLCWLLYRRTLLSRIALLSLFLASSALLVIMNPMAWTPVAERYLYIASGPFVLAFCFWLARLCQDNVKSTWMPILIVPLLLSSAYATVSRNIIWQDNLTLYQDTAKKSPDNMAVKNELALALIASGRQDEGYSLLKSIRAPRGQKASLNHVSAWWADKEYDKARDFLLEELENSGPYELRMLQMLIKTNNLIIETIPEGVERRAYYLENADWLERLHSKTNNPFYWYRLGQVYLAIDEPAIAQTYFAKAAAEFQDSSPYKKPAEKLAKTLSKQ